MEVVKFFVLGKPGCGKSTMARFLEVLARDQRDEDDPADKRRWISRHLNDYSILRAMADQDEYNSGEKRWIRWLDEKDHTKGLDVLNFIAFDKALQQLEETANTLIDQHTHTSSQNLLVFIEFARNDYQKAFAQFNPIFFQNAYFLYLSADVEVCKERIRQRVANPQTEDDYDVSDYIFQAYYNHEADKSLEEILGSYSVETQRVKVLNNNADMKEIWHFQSLNQFMECVFHNELTPVAGYKA